MRASLEWIRDYVDIDVTAEEAARRLADQGFEVESIEESGGEIGGVVVGRILELREHPDAPEWSVTTLDVGADRVTLVTGARNLSPGDIVPVALPGAVLPGGKAITQQNFRGVLSQGMLCSGAELGLSSDASGILILPHDLVPGRAVSDALGLTSDHVLEIEVLQRADCLGYANMAREFAAALNKPWHGPAVTVKEEGGPAQDFLKVRVDAPDLCPRYAARLFTDIQLRPSPWWMVRRLLAAGVRPINNLVDITNYVMLEMNQPLHAFDYSQLQGGQIVVRRAEPGETLTTLDGVLRTLDREMLVIADAVKPVALAGVMGGENSEIRPGVQTVLLESAWFNAVNIRRTSQKLGLRSEASIRFGKGIDPSGVIQAMDRAAQLVEELGAGKVAKGFVDIHGPLPQPLRLTLRPRRVNYLLGADIPVGEMEACLKRLPFEVRPSGENLEVTVPTFRADVAQEVDLVEEIARIYGYDRIPSSMPAGTASGRLTHAQHVERQISQVLCGEGLKEIKSWSMVDPATWDRLGLPEDHPWRRAPRVLMPLSEEQSVMRPGLMGGMMDAASHNARRQQADVRFFELGHVFGELPPSGKELPQEFTQLGVLLMGRDSAANWQHAGREADFFELKGVLENLFARLNVRGVVFEPWEHPAMHPGRTALMRLGHDDIGFMGEVHPGVCERYDLPRRAYYAQVDLPRLYGKTVEPRYQQLPRFPGVERDLALMVPESVPAARVEQCIRNSAGELLERLRLFDVYKGGQVTGGWRSLAFSLLLRHPERTLTEADVSEVMENILDAAAIEVGAQRR